MDIHKTIVGPEHWHFLDDLSTTEIEEADGELYSVSIRVEAKTTEVDKVQLLVPDNISAGAAVHFINRRKYVDSIDSKTLTLTRSGSLEKLKIWLQEKFPERRWYLTSMVIVNGYNQRLNWVRLSTGNRRGQEMRLCLESVDGKQYFNCTYEEMQCAAGEFQATACQFFPGGGQRKPMCIPIDRLPED